MKILSILAQKPSSTGSGIFLTELLKNFQKMGEKQAVLYGIAKEDELPKLPMWKVILYTMNPKSCRFRSLG